MIKFKNILLPTDFSSFSLSAVPYAIELASKYNSVLHILHVQEKTPPILAVRSLELSEEKVNQLLNEEVTRKLNEAKKFVEKNGYDKIETVVRKGVDYQEIVNYCDSAKIDMVVIASHGRTGILLTLIGSVAEKVIRYCKCPVLVVTPKEKKKS